MGGVVQSDSDIIELSPFADGGPTVGFGVKKHQLANTRILLSRSSMLRAGHAAKRAKLETPASRGIRVSRVAGSLGAEVTGGVNLLDLSDERLAELTAALDEHLVLYIPGSPLDRFQLKRLAARFGPPFIHSPVPNQFKDCPEVLELVRTPESNVAFGGGSFHTDASFISPTGHLTILHAVVVPEFGADTVFASTIEAFSKLSDGMKQMLRGLSAVHAYHWYEGREDPEHSATHPVVRVHADGREVRVVCPPPIPAHRRFLPTAAAYPPPPPAHCRCCHSAARLRLPCHAGAVHQPNVHVPLCWHDGGGERPPTQLSV